MSFLTEQKTELAAAQAAEAVLRMKKLKLHGNVIKEFKEEGKLNLSERGILFWLDDEEQKMVQEWQEKTSNMVYHVIKNNMEFGLCYSFLYVSKYQDEWEMDNDDLEEGYPLVYVMNVTDEECSEYGHIGIKPVFGGIVRTA